MHSELGEMAVQDLTRRHIDDPILKVRSGELARHGGRARKKWSARSCNYMLGALSQVLAQLVLFSVGLTSVRLTSVGLTGFEPRPLDPQ